MPRGIPRKKHRVRVRLEAPSPETNEPQVGGEIITPEALAYAMPGGLARLAYPSWIYAPHLRYIEDRILNIADGKSIFLMVSTPPRHGKTRFLSNVVPAWLLGRFPDKRVMLLTHTQDFSRTQSRHARNIIQAFGQKVFDIQLADDSSSAQEWNIAGHTGGMEAIGAGGSLQGKGAHLLIVDDLVKGFEQASSPTMMDKQWDWFRTDVYPRLEPGASVILIMTRWTALDVIGRIEQAQKEEGEFLEFETVNFPALAMEKPKDVLGRSPGQALFPARFDENKLKEIKGKMDDLWFESLYQGNPLPAKGNIINPEWFKTYDGILDRETGTFDQIVISADTASKETELADFSVMMVFGTRGENYYLLDVIRDKIGYPALLDTTKALYRQWRPDFFLIEDKGSGISLIQDMRSDGFVVWPIDPGNENKVIRMQAETPRIRAGAIHIPKEASWRDEFLSEARSFPMGRKDQVDALSQFLKFMRQSSTGVTMW